MIETNDSAGPADVAAITAALKRILVTDVNVSVPIEQIGDEAALDEELKIDSVALIEFISAIEARFDILFLDSDLVTTSFANLRALAEVISERIRVGRAS